LIKQKTMTVLQSLQLEVVAADVLDSFASEGRFDKFKCKFTVEATPVNKSAADLFPAELLNVLRRRGAVQ
jgi:hypothetical protein